MPALVDIAAAMGRNVCSVCVSCDLYWLARAQNVPGDRCMAVDGCGSPLRGDDFHEYKGPMRDFTRWCFVCGDDARFVVRARKPLTTATRPVGVCENHISFFRSLERPTDELPEALTPGTEAALAKKTLAQEMDDFDNSGRGKIKRP